MSISPSTPRVRAVACRSLSSCHDCASTSAERRNGDSLPTDGTSGSNPGSIGVAVCSRDFADVDQTFARRGDERFEAAPALVERLGADVAAARVREDRRRRRRWESRCACAARLACGPAGAGAWRRAAGRRLSHARISPSRTVPSGRKSPASISSGNASEIISSPRDQTSVSPPRRMSCARMPSHFHSTNHSLKRAELLEVLFALPTLSSRATRGKTGTAWRPRRRLGRSSSGGSPRRSVSMRP